MKQQKETAAAERLLCPGEETKRLDSSFFAREGVAVAKELVGKLLVCATPLGLRALRITEIEVYLGEQDTACHAAHGRTKRTEPLYGAGGLYYLYLCYGMHWLLNIVTGAENDPQAVLIRACDGANGPGKLTKALGIDGRFKNHTVEDALLWIGDDGFSASYTADKRVGIGYAAEEDQNRLWRFILKEGTQ